MKNKLIFLNKKILKEKYLQRYITGIVLYGKEVRNIRESNSFDLSKSRIKKLNEEIWLINSPYVRKIKLLLKKKQIRDIETFINNQKTQFVPLSSYWLNSKIKLEIVSLKPKKYENKHKKEKEDKYVLFT
jgi:tmRNA-binding protein